VLARGDQSLIWKNACPATLGTWQRMAKGFRKNGRLPALGRPRRTSAELLLTLACSPRAWRMQERRLKNALSKRCCADHQSRAATRPATLPCGGGPVPRIAYPSCPRR